jgi:ubiquinone/menaquinone biosynthesis C-methylase UbiE
MKKNNTTIYSKNEADSLTHSEKHEKWRDEAENLKASLILKYAKNVNGLLDIGCGWGQTLLKLIGKIPTLAGVDESLERMGVLCDHKKIKTFNCKSDNISIGDNSYDVILMSHIMHEIKLFETPIVYLKTIKEIKRILKKDGKLIVIDHRDPGPGDVIINIGSRINLLNRFSSNFKLRKINYIKHGNNITISKRDCHDFVTKIWCFGTEAEELEMNETHTVMNSKILQNDMIEFNFEPVVNICFNPITNLMKYYGIELIEGNDWGRQLFIQSNVHQYLENKNKQYNVNNKRNDKNLIIKTQ